MNGTGPGRVRVISSDVTTRGLEAAQLVLVDGPFNTTNSGSVSGGPDLILVNGRTFTVARSNGAVTEPSDGTVFEDQRIVSRFDFAITDPEAPHPRRHLSTTSPAPFHAVSVFQPDPRAPASEGEPTEHYVHRQWIGRGVRHDIEIHNAAATSIRRRLEIWTAADFAHLFDVKAGRPDTSSAPLHITDDGLLFSAAEPGDAVRVETEPTPTAIDAEAGRLAWDLTCGPRSSATVTITFEPLWDGEPAGLTFPLGSAPAPFHLATAGRDSATITTTDQRLARAFEQSLEDLASLRIFDPVHPERVVVAAGAPWFMTLFGRDSLLTSWMALPFEPDLAVGALLSLAELQGTRTDPVSEEQPGKILHELRRHSGQSAFGDRGRYYGTVDATPLFVMLAAETQRWGHLDDDHLEHLWPHLEAAIDWILGALAVSSTGFVTYRRSTGQGLLNQGWKDSGDGISFADGRTPTGALALAEVQGYAYAALLGAADMLERSQTASRLDPVELRRVAEQLRERFNTDFWLEDRSMFAVGVTEGGQPIDSLTTNPGHALWTGVADHELAVRHVERTMDELWTGWGLRTLSPEAAAYNPVSYHNGSVWPHDTAIVAAGARRYRCDDAAAAIIDGALDAAEHFDGRPPELFAGIARSDIPAPVTYPGSCSPQAWASASNLLHLRTLAGLEPPLPGHAGLVTANALSDREISVSGIRLGQRTESITISSLGSR